MRTDGVVLEQYPKPRGKMYEPRRSVNVKPRLESQIQMQGVRVAGMEMEMEMEKNYT